MTTRIKTLAAEIRTISPTGAAAIFGLAYIAGLLGSIVLLLVSIAFIVGLYLSTRTVAVETSGPGSAPLPPIAGTAAAVPSVDALSAFGLPVSEIKFKQPAAARPRKVEAA